MAGSTAAVSGGTPTAEGAKPDTIVVKPAETEPPHLLKSIRASTGLQPSPGYEVHWYAFE